MVRSSFSKVGLGHWLVGDKEYQTSKVGLGGWSVGDKEYQKIGGRFVNQ